jgi:uncharacterized protein YpiB (UPF0302 family)
MDRREAIIRFSHTPLKHPGSKAFLEYLLNDSQLMERIFFVEDQNCYADTILISEQGSPKAGFELELGVHQLVEVTLINGRVIRQTKRNSMVKITDPSGAIKALNGFNRKLYVEFAFAGLVPDWYREVTTVKQTPVLINLRSGFDMLVGEIIREQIDLLLTVITLRRQIEQSLECKDKEEFMRLTAVYKKAVSRCLWRLD